MSAPAKYTLKLIDARWCGTRLDKYLMQKMGVPWSASHKLIRSKHCYVLRPDSTTVMRDISYKLQPGDTLSIKDESIEFTQEAVAKNPPVRGNLADHIVFENTNMIVINKPSGLPC